MTGRILCVGLLQGTQSRAIRLLCIESRCSSLLSSGVPYPILHNLGMSKHDVADVSFLETILGFTRKKRRPPAFRPRDDERHRQVAANYLGAGPP